jgi:hypothetical protein
MKNRNDVATQAALMRGLVEAVISFMARTGMSPAKIQRVFRNCLLERSALKQGRRDSRTSRLEYGCDTVAGAVLRAWHRHPQYLDDSAKPIPLKVTGPKPNLPSLIHSQSHAADAQAVLKSMINAGLVTRRRDASYLPAKESATIDALDPLSVDHIAKTVIRLVETASRNIASTRGKVPLIERYAHVPDLSRSEARAFAIFSRQQGQACLDTIEDWLESRQAGSRPSGSASTKGVSAGVHIFAFVGKAPARKSIGYSKKGKRPTPPREARV